MLYIPNKSGLLKNQKSWEDSARELGITEREEKKLFKAIRDANQCFKNDMLAETIEQGGDEYDER